MAFGANITGVTCPLTITGGKLQGITKNAATLSTADAMDEKGNIHARATYGGGSTSYSATYTVVGQTTLAGNIGATNGVESVAVNTSNGAYPSVVVTWREYPEGVSTCGSDFAISITIPACKVASDLGAFTLSGDGALLNSSNVTFSCSVTEVQDEDGNVTAAAFSGGTASGGAQAVESGDASAVFAAKPDWQLTSDGPSVTSSNTAYATASVSFTKFLAENAA